jgi:ABC-type Fe3+/spermidine/putrescine transport system ATPase subunit
MRESLLAPGVALHGTTTDLTAGPPAIALRGVSKRYGDAVALHPLDLDIREGEFFCLLGPSGCGKTTTLNLLGGFVAPSRGEIHLRGERIDQLPAHRQPVNTVFQSYALFPHMSVRDNVAFGLKMARVGKAEAAIRVRRALERVGVSELAERMPTQLSGGQQQRVAVARALVNEPAVLLLDEPLGALDLKLRQRLQIELAQIHRDVGTTFVFVTHDQEEAMALGDRIAVMDAGRMEQVGTPHEIYLRPRSRFVAEFIGESNLFEVVFEGGVARLPDGAILPAPAHPPGVATLVVRPESIAVSRDGEGIPARLVHTSFLGRETRLDLTLVESGLAVTASIAGSERGRLDLLELDREMRIAWHEDDAVVLHTKSPKQEGHDA